MAKFMEPVAVLGLGRFGTSVALELARRGTEVLAVDRHEGVVQRLAGQLGRVIAADTTDVDALKEIGLEHFDRAVVAIGSDQQSSILTTAALTDLEVGTIWAKAQDPQHARILHRIGAHHVVQPESDMGERVGHLASSRLLDYVELDDDWAVIKINPPRTLVGDALDGERIRQRYDVSIVSVKAEGASEFGHLDATTSLGYGAEILVVGRVADIERFAELD